MNMAEWGESGEGIEIEGQGHNSLPREIDLGGGFKLVISPDAFRTVMHTPEITAQVQQRCQELAETATAMATVEGAEYTYFVSNNPDNIRARGRVKPANDAARRDDAENSTLLKALASVGSDPRPVYNGHAEGATEPSASEAVEAVSEVLE